MKKIFALVLALSLMLGAVSALADDCKIGLGLTTRISTSKDATADADGSAVVYSFIAAVTVDAEGKITAADLDVLQAKVAFNAQGKLTSDLTALALTKTEIADNYGMKKISPIGKEYYEQLAGLEEWLIGKTAAEFKAAVEGKDETLLAVCTVSMTDMVTAVEKAVAAALAE